MMRRFVSINAARQVENAISRVLVTSFPCCITSSPGMGKTTALVEQAKKHNFAYMEANQSIRTAGGLYKAILFAYDYGSDKKYASDLYGILSSRFGRYNDRERPRLLIVDEFQILSPSLQRDVLHFNDVCNVPILFSGNPQRLASSKIDKMAYEQISSRLGQPIVIRPPTEADCDALSAEFNIEGMDAYKAVRNFGHNRSIREITRLLETAVSIRQGAATVQLRHLQQATRMLYGDDDLLTNRSRGKNRA